MTHNWRARLLGPCLALLAGSLPGHVFAFSEPSIYGSDPATGGGGGRWFTGSPADGYGCSTCHSGPGGAPVTVTGLPMNGYIPGNVYIVKLNWSVLGPFIQSAEQRGLRPSTGLVAEFVAEDGTNSGTLALEPEFAQPSERCRLIAGEETPRFASTIFDAPGDGSEPTEVTSCSTDSTEAMNQRCIVAIRSCGSSELRIKWTAPEKWRGPIWFAGGFVTTEDATGIPNDNDYVTELVVPMNPAADGPVYETTIEGGCAVARPAPAADSGAWLLSWAVVGATWWRRSRVRRRARSRTSRTSLLDAARNAVPHGVRWTQFVAALLIILGSACDEGTPAQGQKSSFVGLYTPAEFKGAAGDAPTKFECMSPVLPQIPVDGADDSDDADGGVKQQHPGGALHVALTTDAMHGVWDKSPAEFWHAGAIWIEDDMGHFVKTLQFWIATKYKFQSCVSYQYLTAKRYGCDDEMDVMTGATLSMHTTHDLDWDGKDLTGYVVPDGNYRLRVELTVDEKEEHVIPVAMYDFVKGRTPWTIPLPAGIPLRDGTLTYTPAK